MKLGLVTYNMAKDWDIPTIISVCKSTGFKGVELRTTHKHGVETFLSSIERKSVKSTFEESGIELIGLGTVFEFHSIHQEVVRENIEGTKEYVKLAHDVGAQGVKVRPNGHQEEMGVPREKTLEQIGIALRECGTFARDYGVEIRLEMHGSVAEAWNIRRIMEYAGEGNAFVCWNSNPCDVKDRSLAEDFNMVKDWIHLVHINELYNPKYPYVELFQLLKTIDYKGLCCAEIPYNPEPERFLKYYKALYDALVAL